jgi:hypothetical protein
VKAWFGSLAAIGAAILMSQAGARLLQGETGAEAARAESTSTVKVAEKSNVGATNHTANTITNTNAAADEDLAHMQVARAVMVTVELDLGPKVPSVAEALKEIERRYEPLDGVGRTFAILDAYGERTARGKMHMSMHVSTEKPGGASLVFKRTGEILWHTDIVKATNATAATVANKGLIILLDNGAGQTVTVDGSKNPRSILEATAKEMGVLVGDIWPEGSEREVTFLYSACGCPVKVMAMRVGDKTIRTRELPVIFPDDPAVVTVIKRVMRWD